MEQWMLHYKEFHRHINEILSDSCCPFIVRQQRMIGHENDTITETAETKCLHSVESYTGLNKIPN